VLPPPSKIPLRDTTKRSISKPKRPAAILVETLRTDCIGEHLAKSGRVKRAVKLRLTTPKLKRWEGHGG
jgi:hypothetical protein